MDPETRSDDLRVETDLSNVEVTFIGTATVLLRWGSTTILTDPNFLHAGEYAPLGYGLRSKRVLEPAMQMEDLPPLDAVVLSHHHGDHFDPTVVRRLDKSTPILTEPSSAKKLARQGFRAATPLRTWQHGTVGAERTGIRVTAVPGRHAPEPLGSMLPPVMGSMLELLDGDRVAYRIYVTGDTLMYDRLRHIPARYPDIDLCLIHLGGTRVGGVLVTMDARQGIEALRLVRPKVASPIHTDDYTIFKSPLRDFLRDAGRTTLPCELVVLERGEPHRFPVG